MTAKKALIVDDSRLAQFVLKKMLLGHDISVDTAESAEDALNYLDKKKPDLIFLDHTMPGMNGLEVLKIIKEQPATAAIPVMMYTSQEDSSYMSRARELGAIDVLPKQLKAKELEQALKRLSDIDQAQEQAITSAAAKQTLLAEKEELKQLVMDAEAALEQETIEQKLRQRIDRHSEKSEQAIASIHSKIDALIPAVEYSRNKQTFWNNVLWGAIYGITVAIFAAFYLQQQNKIDRIETSRATSPAAAAPRQSTPPPQARIAATARPQEQRANLAAPAPRPQNQQEVSALEQQFNSNNQIPFNELLLSDTIQANLNELIAALRALDFSGRVNLLAHDGNFCVNTNESGLFDLAADDTPVTQCQITEASGRLVDIASIDLLQLITASNKSADSDFVITIQPFSTSRPLENYPPLAHESTAMEWNSVALKNRRIEVQLVGN